MKTIILTVAMLGVASTSAQAAGTTQCDSKPFTLKKSAPPAAKPVVEQAKKPVPQPFKIASTPAKPKAKPIADCDKPAKQSRG